MLWNTRHISTGVCRSLLHQDPATSISGTKEAFSIISQHCYSRVVVGHQMGSDLDPWSSIVKVTHPRFCRCPSVEPLVSGHCSDLHKTKPPRHCLHSMNRITCLIKLALCQREDVEDSTHKSRSEVEATVISWCEKLSLLFYMTHLMCNMVWKKNKKNMGIVTCDGNRIRKEFNDSPILVTPFFYYL